MLTAANLTGQRVYRLPAAGKETDRKGNPRKPHKLGKVHGVVFSPDGTRVVGVQVRQPDVAAMVKRPDVFVALDALGPYDAPDVRKPGYAFADGAGASDKAAVKRLGLDLDRCLMWVGMDVRTEGGRACGYVADAAFDERTGEVASFSLTDGGAANALLGTRSFGTDAVVGYREGCMVVKDEIATSGFSGGIAAKAGAAAGAARVKAAEAGERAKAGAAKASKATGEATTKGAKVLGRQLGKTKGMFSSFKAEFDKASK